MNRALPGPILDLIRDGVPAADLASAESRRAMPGWAVDRIRDGVPSSELRAHGGTKAINGALVSVAMSAIQAGQTWPEWHAALTSPESNLGRQSHLDRRRRDIGPRQHLKNLQSAWRRAESRIAESPPFSADDVRRRARRLLDDDPMIPWTATRCTVDRLVFRHAIGEAAARGHTRPTLPVRSITETTGVSKSAAARSLNRLTEAGLLQLHRRGDRGADSKRAAVYVVVPLTLPIGRWSYGPYVPPDQTLCPTPQPATVPPSQETTRA